MSIRRLLVIVVLVGSTGACAPRSALKRSVSAPVPAAVIAADRILIAGFIATSVTDRGRVIDVNEETARYLRSLLRDGSARVLNTAPMDLPASRNDVPTFNDIRFWRLVGEEYDRPLIVTGTVRLVPLAPRPEERLAGRRLIRIWLPAVSLAMELVLIDGRTGERIQTLQLPTITQTGKALEESSLSLYYDAMRRLATPLAEALGQTPRTMTR